jgi:hypothetical protein
MADKTQQQIEKAEAKVREHELYFSPTADQANAGHKHLVEYCLNRYEDAKTSKYRAKKMEEIRLSIEEYEQDEKPTTEPWEGAANYSLPLTTISCDNLEPRMVAGLVGKRPVVRFEPENNQPQDEMTEILQTWYNQELENVIGVEEMARSAVHRILQEGTVYMLPYYDIDEAVRSDFTFQDDVEQMVIDDPVFSQEMAQNIEKGLWTFENGILMDVTAAEPVLRDYRESLFEGGRYDLVPFSDVYIPDDADDWEKTPVIRKVYPTYAQLRRDEANKSGYMNIGPWLCDQAGEETAMTQEQQSPAQKYDDVQVNGKKTIECIECSITYMYQRDDGEEKDNPNFEEERMIAQIALDSKILIRLIPLRDIYHKNQLLLKRLRLFPEKGKSYGTGMAAKLKSIQKGASKTFNTALNIVDITMIPWWLYTENTGIKRRYPRGIKLKAGIGLPVDSTDGLYFPRFSINPDQMINWINLWITFWERVTSIGDLQIGRQSDEKRTATETMAVIQEGNIKHNYQSTSIREDFLDVIRAIYDLYYQHMPFDKTFKWKGKEVRIPRALMRRIKKFVLTGATELSNKLIQRKEKEDLYNLTAQDPNVNPIKRAEELIKSYGHSDTTEWISPGIKAVTEAIAQDPKLGEAVAQFIQQAQQQAAVEQQAQEAMQKEEQRDALNDYRASKKPPAEGAAA